MSNQHSQPDAGSAMAAKILARNAALAAQPAAAAPPPVQPVAAPAAAESDLPVTQATGHAAPAVTSQARPGRKPRTGREATQLTQTVSIDPGEARVTITSRIPKMIHGRLKFFTLGKQMGAASVEEKMRYTIDNFVAAAIIEKMEREAEAA